MRKQITIIICVLASFLAVAQEPDFNRHDITPANITVIGGLSTYKGLNYMLINTNLVYSKRINEVSESRSIRQKYPEWEIHSFSPGKVDSNMFNNWPVKNASPNGFSILDDNTVVYIDKNSKLRSNDPVLNKQFEPLFDRKYKYHFPSTSSDSKKIYFSSDMPGGYGGYDIWYIEKEGFMWSAPKNMGETINTISDELNTLQINDSVFVFSSNRNTGKGIDFLFYDMNRRSLFEVNSNINSASDELFMCNLDTVSIYVDTRASELDKIYSVRWYQERKEEQTIIASTETLLPQKVDKLDEKPVVTPPKVVVKEEPDNMSLTRYFELAKYELTPQMVDSLTGISKKINEDKSLSILICGHASPDGTDFINMMLSYQRANTASDWLKDHQVSEESIFRIYGGEYLFEETNSARRFSVFSLNMTDIPKQLVVIRMDNPNQLNDILTRFDIDEDETAFIKGELAGLLPVANENIVLVPVSDLFFTKEGDTLFSISAKYGIPIAKIMKVNNLKSEIISANQFIYIPLP